MISPLSLLLALYGAMTRCLILIGDHQRPMISLGNWSRLALPGNASAAIRITTTSCGVIAAAMRDNRRASGRNRSEHAKGDADDQWNVFDTPRNCQLAYRKLGVSAVSALPVVGCSVGLGRNRRFVVSSLAFFLPFYAGALHPH